MTGSFRQRKTRRTQPRHGIATWSNKRGGRDQVESFGEKMVLLENLQKNKSPMSKNIFLETNFFFIVWVRTKTLNVASSPTLSPTQKRRRLLRGASLFGRKERQNMSEKMMF